MSRYEIRIQEPDATKEYHWICVQGKGARQYAKELFDELRVEFPPNKFFTNMASYPGSKGFKTTARDTMFSKCRVINLDITE